MSCVMTYSTISVEKVLLWLRGLWKLTLPNMTETLCWCMWKQSPAHTGSQFNVFTVYEIAEGACTYFACLNKLILFLSWQKWYTNSSLILKMIVSTRNNGLHQMKYNRNKIILSSSLMKARVSGRNVGTIIFNNYKLILWELSNNGMTLQSLHPSLVKQ